MSRVTVTNPYDLLTDENEDRTNVPAPKKEQKPVAAPSKPAAKPAATGVAKPAAAKPAAPKAEGTKAPAKTDAKATPKPAGGNANQVVKPAPIRDSNQNLQERDKESRAPRDKRDYRQAPVAGDRQKRSNDRKSGTGRIAGEQKKGGGGKANWGADVDPKDTVEAIKEAKEKTPEEQGEEAKEEKVVVEGEKKEGETKEDAPVAPAEPETYTLEEYLAKKAKTAIAGLETLKPRTVNADELGAAGMVPLQRGETGTAPLQPKEKKDKKVAAAASPAAEKPAGEKKEKENLAAKLLSFASHEDSFKRRGGDRPFRQNYDNNRQGGERRAPRNNNNNTRAPRNNAAQDASKPPVQEKDFPTLNVKA